VARSQPEVEGRWALLVVERRMLGAPAGMRGPGAEGILVYQDVHRLIARRRRRLEGGPAGEASAPEP
jgi:hypothetical protein